MAGWLAISNMCVGRWPPAPRTQAGSGSDGDADADAGSARQAQNEATANTSVVILGGVHGNELLGVRVVKELLGVLQCSSNQRALNGMQGTLTVAIGNPAAVAIGKRATSAVSDLNRCFSADIGTTGEPGASTQGCTPEQQRALDLAPILRGADVLLDIHATNKPSDPFIRVAGHFPSANSDICQWLPAAKILLDPHFVLANGATSTTDEYVGHHNGIGICLETGQASDMGLISHVRGAVLHLLETQLGLSLDVTGTAFEHATVPSARVQEHYELEQAVTLSEDGFAFASGRGDYNFEFIPEGGIIGHVPGKVMPPFPTSTSECTDVRVPARVWPY